MNKNFTDLLNRLRNQDKNFYFVEYPLKDKTRKELKDKIKKGKEK
jgi:hypothetical protein